MHVEIPRLAYQYFKLIRQDLMLEIYCISSRIQFQIRMTMLGTFVFVYIVGSSSSL